MILPCYNSLQVVAYPENMRGISQPVMLQIFRAKCHYVVTNVTYLDCIFIR